MSAPPAEDRLVTGPNLLTLSRLGWAAGLFVCVSYEAWLAGLVIFAVAAFSDWLDGFWARKTNQISAVGRALDPLVDKVLVCGAFIFLLPVGEAGLRPWMVTAVVGRELFITGLRGIVERRGKSFGADRLGKLKMFLQCAALVAILSRLAFAGASWLAWPQLALLWLMLAATIVSGLEYLWRAYRLLR